MSDHTNQEILRCIGNLSNHIVAGANSKRLISLRESHPNNFSNPLLFIEANRIATTYQLRIPNRRFIHDLFDRVVWNAKAVNELDQCRGLNYILPVSYHSHSGASKNEIASKEGKPLSPPVEKNISTRVIKRGGF